MPSTRGFTVTYASARRLDADHVAYLAHGGLVVPLDEAQAPPSDTPVEVRLEAPGARRFLLSGTAQRWAPSRGLMISFSDRSRAALSALDGYVASADFVALRSAEPLADEAPPEVRPFEVQEVEDVRTDAGLVAPPDLQTQEEAPRAPGTDPRARPGRRRPRPAPSNAHAELPERTSPILRAPRRRRPIPGEASTPSGAVPVPSSPSGTEASRTADLDEVRTPAPATEDLPEAGRVEHDDTYPAEDGEDALSAATIEGAMTPEAAPAAEVVAPEPGDATEDTPPAADLDPAAEAQKIRSPEPGEEFLVFVVKFPTVTSFADLAEAFRRDVRLTVPYEDDRLTPIGCVTQLRLTMPGRNIFEMWGVVASVAPDAVVIRVDEDDEAFRKALLHPTTIAARKRLEREAEQPPEAITALRIKKEQPKEDIERMPIRRRLARMGMDDKINMALSGGREERMALAMDGNKAVHHYLLKNAKITLDEIAFMARLPSLNPDVLDKIAENPAYTQNPTVTKALVYNPRTPIRTAIRLLDRLPRSEVMNLAKRTTMNQRLVMAAKKKIERRSR